MIVKICGLVWPDDAADAVAAGADWIGINFWPRSTRYVDIERAREVAAAARAAGPVEVVGVFVNQPDHYIETAVAVVGLDRVQLHGDEPPAVCARYERVVKAVPLASRDDVMRISQYSCEMFLIDTPTAGYGGSGRTGDWTLARAAVEAGHRVLLAGGLTPDNVAAAIAAVAPAGVDVAGGVEAGPGVKDKDIMRRFVAAAREAKR